MLTDIIVALILVVLISLVTYRITRFIILDSLVERWRESAYEWLLSPLAEHERDLVIDVHEDGPLRQLPMWRRKLYQLLSCPFCISVWVAGAVVAATDLRSNTDVILPVWVWLASSAGSLVVYTYIDAED